MSTFNSLLLSLSKEIVKSELETMKRYCSDHEIGAKRLEEISDAYQLFEELRKRDLLGPDKTGILVELLEKAGRIDLKNKVLGTQGPSRESSSSTQQPSTSVPDGPVANEIVKESHLSEISEDLGKDWKMLGRKLGISSTILENVDEDHRRVKEKAIQTMLRWKKRSGNNATGQVLANALVAIGRRDVAETLADLCRKDGVHIHTSEEGTQNSSTNKSSKTESDALDTMPADLKLKLPMEESRP